jgi:hypothetical protein
MKSFKDWLDEGYTDDHYWGDWQADPQNAIAPHVPNLRAQNPQKAITQKVNSDKTAIYRPGAANASMPNAAPVRTSQEIITRLDSIEQQIQRIENLVRAHAASGQSQVQNPQSQAQS